MIHHKKKIFVGMSGGVDSSVSAALLKAEGHDVTGVFIKVWQADFLPCNWREERRDAMRAAAQLGIPFYTLDLESTYKREVVDYMVREYAVGRIPNPDVMCNKFVKFGAFFEFAKQHGATHIATGHYAQIVNTQGVFQIQEGKDQEKDQSYFLWTLDQKGLSHTLFPIGGLMKPEVRKLAHQFQLANAEKKDSQGLCFMGKIDMREFLKHYLKTEEGNVLDEGGIVIGVHEGAMLYTIGQRHGFTLHNASHDSKPRYVIGKNIENNTITVATKDPNVFTHSTTAFQTQTLHECWDGSIPNHATLSMRFRYHGDLHPVTIKRSADDTVHATITLISPKDTIPEGQSAVFYDGKILCGGAVIDQIMHT